MQVHTKRCNRLLHDRMRDLVFIKFNSRLKQKRDNKDRDPIEIPVHDVILEDGENEWITGIEQTEGGSDQEKEKETGASSQGLVAAPRVERTRRGGQENSRSRKRKRLIPTFEEEVSSPSSDGGDDNDIDDQPIGSDSEAAPLSPSSY
ncbi:Unknown protein [Striga hermonthica]|nr:Unknown protein [Striga hermonthica]